MITLHESYFYYSSRLSVGGFDEARRYVREIQKVKKQKQNKTHQKLRITSGRWPAKI